MGQPGEQVVQDVGVRNVVENWNGHDNTTQHKGETTGVEGQRETTLRK